jgi:hypothetical protein
VRNGEKWRFGTVAEGLKRGREWFQRRKTVMMPEEKAAVNFDTNGYDEASRSTLEAFARIRGGFAQLAAEIEGANEQVCIACEVGDHERHECLELYRCACPCHGSLRSGR